MKLDLDCLVVKDLYPLYVDKDLSPEVTEALNDHLQVCAECRNSYKQGLGLINYSKLARPLPARSEEILSRKLKGMSRINTILTILLLFSPVIYVTIMEPISDILQIPLFIGPLFLPVWGWVGYRFALLSIKRIHSFLLGNSLTFLFTIFSFVLMTTNPTPIISDLYILLYFRFLPTTLLIWVIFGNLAVRLILGPLLMIISFYIGFSLYRPEHEVYTGEYWQYD